MVSFEVTSANFSSEMIYLNQDFDPFSHPRFRSSRLQLLFTLIFKNKELSTCNSLLDG